MAATAALGFWQLDRAAQKIGIRDAMTQQEALPALDAAALRGRSGPAEGLLHRRITVEGEWVAGRTVYLDNRQMDGRTGFYVLTPLRLDQDLTVVVQRGWIPRNFEDRSRLEPVVTPAGPVLVTGRLERGPARLYEFGNSSAVRPAFRKDGTAAPGDNAPGSSAIRQNLDITGFRVETGLPLADWSVVEIGNDDQGLRRRWPQVASGVDRHYGYAFQWFGLSALIAFLYVWYQLIRRPRSATPHGAR